MAGLSTAWRALPAPSNPVPDLRVSGARLKRRLLCLPKVGAHPLQAPPPCSSGLRALERKEEVDEVDLKCSPAGLAAHRPCHHPHSCREAVPWAAEGNSVHTQCLLERAVTHTTGKASLGLVATAKWLLSGNATLSHLHPGARAHWHKGLRNAWQKACRKHHAGPKHEFPLCNFRSLNDLQDTGLFYVPLRVSVFLEGPVAGQKKGIIQECALEIRIF